MTRNVSDLVKVKPLQWEELKGIGTGPTFSATTPFGAYRVIDTLVGRSMRVRVYFTGLGNKPLFTKDTIVAAKAAAQADYESRILADLTPAEQCFSVKEGYAVRSCRKIDYDPRGEYWKSATLSDALTIRSAEEVRREFAESLRKACLDTEQGHELLDWVLANCWGIDTPAPSTDTTLSVAEAAKVLLDAHGKGEWPIGRGNSVTFVSVTLESLRALAAQTGGE